MRKKGEKIRVVVYLLFIVAKGDFKLLENVEDKFENAKEMPGFCNAGIEKIGKCIVGYSPFCIFAFRLASTSRSPREVPAATLFTWAVSCFFPA